MKTPSVLHTFLAAFAASASIYSGSATASGGDGFSENAFTPEYHVPPADLPSYAAGNLGVVAPSYWRVYHFLAYRALSGHPLSKDEVARLEVDGWRVGDKGASYDYTYSDDKNGVGSWLKARELVKGARKVEIGIEAPIGDFAMIINCHRDAFDRAAKTLEQRIAQGGQQWAAAWLANQDAVFANCSTAVPFESRAKKDFQRPLVMPPALPPKAPDWLIKDHAYQSAAAAFYAGRYDDARERFLSIANDAKSPWQNLGKYLAARCLLRKASTTLTADSSKEQRNAILAMLKTARSEMTVIAREYPPAQRLVTWIDFRLRPEERRRELSAILSSAKVGDETPQMLTDYLFLLDQMAPEKMAAAADAATAWIGIMQASAEGLYSGSSTEAEARRKPALESARAQWNRKREVLWLVPLLTNARPGDLKPAELEAAAAVKEDSPAYVGIQYHLARHAITAGKPADADAIVSAMLKKPLPPYVRNRWLRMKMVTAKNAEEFFAAAPRIPAERERGTPIPNEGAAAQDAAPEFDDDLHARLVRHFSLKQLMRLKPLIPARQQQNMSELMWTRAVLLGDFETADKLTPELMQGRDTTRHLYERFKDASSAEQKKNAALIILSNTPELNPMPTHPDPYGTYKERPVSWSCSYYSGSSDDRMELLPPAFQSAEERTQAEEEQKRLRALPLRTSYLIPQVIDWAKSNKKDTEAPKALHFLVASTRSECPLDGGSTAKKRNYSKEAFQFLHSQFPKSEWTAKTRYYY